MANAFKQQKNVKRRPKRHTFDLSHYRHGTYQFGNLYPVFYEEVLNGDSARIKLDVGFEFMPTVFPVLNQIKGYVHFFYCRYRNLHDKFMDFIFENDLDIVPPYLSPSSEHPEMYKTGGLLDHLGVPTTVFKDSPFISPSVVTLANEPSVLQHRVFSSARVLSDGSCSTEYFLTPSSGTSYASFSYTPDNFIKVSGGGVSYNLPIPDILNPTLKAASCIRAPFTSYPSNVPDSSVGNILCFRLDDSRYVSNTKYRVKLPNFYYKKLGPDSTPFTIAFVSVPNSPSSEVLLSPKIIPSSDISVSELPDEDGYSLEFTLKDATGITYPGRLLCYVLCRGFVTFDTDTGLNGVVLETPTTGTLVDYSDSSRIQYGRDLKLSAFPCRAYESIYNAFYRDTRNNPYILDGRPEYNKYIPTSAGGEDHTEYKMHSRNWALDAYTSAVQSPQQGVAPLVGITSLGDVTFASEDGKQYTFKTTVAEDGDTIESVNMRSSGESVIPQDVSRGILNLVSQGISINDFRNVNAYQRFKETNIRRGLKYRDQILSRWGVDVKYSTLDMPEFIGGISIDISPSKVNQTVETDSVPLGGYAGQLSGRRASNNSINCYCDEAGCIIGILSIAPQPVYDMVLPRYMHHRDALEYYNPEFDRIGMQSIKYSEVSPLLVTDKSQLDSTFGYQRPWHQYLFKPDTSHGDFRLSLRNYLLSRQFRTAPYLGPDFLTINPDTLNNVFTTGYDNDKILGVIKFDAKFKRPISAVSIPSL